HVDRTHDAGYLGQERDRVPRGQGGEVLVVFGDRLLDEREYADGDRRAPLSLIASTLARDTSEGGEERSTRAQHSSFVTARLRRGKLDLASKSIRKRRGRIRDRVAAWAVDGDGDPEEAQLCVAPRARVAGEPEQEIPEEPLRILAIRHER